MDDIIKVEGIESKVPAYYDILQDKIYYDSTLDNFPLLKECVINHEKDHQRKPLNLFWHVYIDVRDNIKMIFTPQCIDLILFERENIKKNARSMSISVALIFFVYPVINGILCLMLKIVGLPFKSYYKYKIKKLEAS